MMNGKMWSRRPVIVESELSIFYNLYSHTGGCIFILFGRLELILFMDKGCQANEVFVFPMSSLSGLNHIAQILGRIKLKFEFYIFGKSS